MSAPLAGQIGTALAVLGAALAVSGLLAVLPRLLRVRRRRRSLERVLESNRTELAALLAAWRELHGETEQAWRPYRRILRWLRHPLVGPLLYSLRRRRRLARQARAAR